MEENKRKAASLVERMKKNLQKQKRDVVMDTEASLQVLSCPNCGAGRAKGDGLTKCAYCQFAFMEPKITQGIHLKKTDNSI